MLVRLIDVSAGKPNRFTFRNIRLEPHKPTHLKYGGWLGPASEARLEVTDDHVTLCPTKGEVRVNGEPVHDHVDLANGDLIALHWKTQVDAHEFESDLRFAKQARWRSEAERGIHRSPPDLTGEVSQRLAARWAVDEKGITFRNAKNPRKDRTLAWEELDAVVMEPARGQADYGDDAVGAAGKGVDEGVRLGNLIVADEKESDLDPVFHAPAYLIRFRCRGKDLVTDVGRSTDCEWLAKAIEYYAPIDLTKLGSFVGV